MTDEVVLVKADPAWPRLFAEEKARLLAEFGPRFMAIEHFGSTAVAGLDAKPIIDLLGGVASLEVADALLEPLCRIGYDTSPEFNATLPERRFLLRWPQGIRTHHLHLVIQGSAEWQRRLAFRDQLRADSDLRERYQALKYELAARYRDDREAYTEAKTDFVSRALGES